MDIPATDCAINVAYWYLSKADKEKQYLGEDKLQHLLFLSQLNYATKYNMAHLMPSIFVCDSSGFREANISCLLASLGRIKGLSIKFSDKIESFLEDIWRRYGSKSTTDLENLIKSSVAYKDNYLLGTRNIVPLRTIVQGFSTDRAEIFENKTEKDKKILFSQNGPVMVSKWQPRKVHLRGESNE